MNNEQPNNPLHGVKLADILEHLVDKYGWEFLRKTPWAREKVEDLYLRSLSK